MSHRREGLKDEMWAMVAMVTARALPYFLGRARATVTPTHAAMHPSVTHRRQGKCHTLHNPPGQGSEIGNELLLARANLLRYTR